MSSRRVITEMDIPHLVVEQNLLFPCANRLIILITLKTPIVDLVND